jgi:hypothetical protein
MGLSTEVILELEQHASNKDYQSYYQTLIDNGVGYGYMGLAASTDGKSGNALPDLAGILANN